MPLWWRRSARAVLKVERTFCRSARRAKCNYRSTVRNDVLSCDTVRSDTPRTSERYFRKYCFSAWLLLVFMEPFCW